MKLISCMDSNYGIGKDGKLPWYLKEDLRMFKRETLNKKVLFGRKTAENLPNLPKREVFVLSHERRGRFALGNNLITFIGVDEVTSDMIICGGAEIYRHFLEKDMVTSVILGRISKSYDCDTFFPFNLLEKRMGFKVIADMTENYTVERLISTKNFTHTAPKSVYRLGKYSLDKDSPDYLEKVKEIDSS